MKSLFDMGPPMGPVDRRTTWPERRAAALAAQRAPYGGGYICAACGRPHASLDVVLRDGALVGLCRGDRVKLRAAPRTRQREIKGTRRARPRGWSGMGEGSGI